MSFEFISKYMQQFVVPQFIDNEDKILGPITVRQFLIILVAVIICAAFYKLADFTGFLLALVFIGGGSIVLAFVKVNGRPFHYFVLSLIQLVLHPSIRVWKLEKPGSGIKQNVGSRKPETHIPRVVKRRPLSVNRLSELSLLVDTGGQYHPEEDIFNK